MASTDPHERYQDHERPGMSARGVAAKHPLHLLIVLIVALFGTSIACAPTVDVLGVYFPGWLISTIAGVVFGYGLVLVLSRRPATRELADSGLFFLGLVVAITLSAWWLFFSAL